MLRTLVMRPCWMRKWGLSTLRPTEWKRLVTCFCCAVRPLTMYLVRPSAVIWRERGKRQRFPLRVSWGRHAQQGAGRAASTWRVTVMESCWSYPTGLPAFSLLSNTTETEALVMPASPPL